MVLRRAREKDLFWRVVFCGSREGAFRRFRNARPDRRYDTFVLLVDSEERPSGPRRQHLKTQDGWSLGWAEEDAVHLMVCVMETWLVADETALTSYYGPHFRSGSLPRSRNLEAVPKQDILRGLERATRRTQKGRYHKIGHASELLKRVDPEKVQRRCPACRTLFDSLYKLIRAA